MIQKPYFAVAPNRVLATLPNSEGFRFIGVTWQGDHVRCTVVRDPVTGLHGVDANRWPQLAYWRAL
jgi:hypothetical protein